MNADNDRRFHGGNEFPPLAPLTDPVYPVYHDRIPDPETEIPVDDPPVPNRAWTEMRLGRDIEELSEEEKADLYLGHDNYL